MGWDYGRNRMFFRALPIPLVPVIKWEYRSGGSEAPGCFGILFPLSKKREVKERSSLLVLDLLHHLGNAGFTHLPEREGHALLYRLIRVIKTPGEPLNGRFAHPAECLR
jgi:hypothetical protein